MHRLGLLDTVVMTRSFEPGSGRRFVRSLLVATLCAVVSSACAVNHAPNASPSVLNRVVKTAHLDAQPLEVMLPKLHPDSRAYLEAFAATVPESLPEMAYASSVILEPTKPDQNPLIVKLSDGYAEVQIGIANPGSNINRPNVLCLRNGAQVGCTLEIDVWEVALPPKTMVFLSTRMLASPGDLLTFLVLAHNEPRRLEPGSQMVWAYAEQQPDPPSASVIAPTQAQVLGGCDFATFVKDPADSTSPLNLFRNSYTQWGTILYLLIQLCNPTGLEYVQLVPIVDRSIVIDLPGEFWHSAVRLVDTVSVIPLDTAQLSPVKEFQVAVMPLSKEAASALRINKFTHAVAFSD